MVAAVHISGCSLSSLKEGSAVEMPVIMIVAAVITGVLVALQIFLSLLYTLGRG